jgi:hypothetical protein
MEGSSEIGPESWRLLSQFEPDPDGFGAYESSGRHAEGLDWLTWTDVDEELSWAQIEILQITPRVTVVP